MVLAMCQIPFLVCQCFNSFDPQNNCEVNIGSPILWQRKGRHREVKKPHTLVGGRTGI